MSKIIFDGTCHDYTMRNNGFYCGFNMPEAETGEQINGLPGYSKRMPYLVDEYPACPKNWMRSKGKVKSYFVPVVEGKGMWLDFNENQENQYHLAIVISIQGVNPVTGLPCKEAKLEQYSDKCPKHNVDFGPERYCDKCRFHWPKQNYISTTGTPKDYFWLDGFKAANGIVRQYILTAEKMKGVAANTEGVKENRVYAVGVSFFLSKDKKPVQQQYEPSQCFYMTDDYIRGDNMGSSSSHSSCSQDDDDDDDEVDGITTTTKTTTGNSFVQTEKLKQTFDALRSRGPKVKKTPYDQPGIIYGEPQFFNPVHTPINWQIPASGIKDFEHTVGKVIYPQPNLTSPVHPAQPDLTMGSINNKAYSKYPKDPRSIAHVVTRRGAVRDHVKQTTKLEVGAGAKISQRVHDDPERLDFWHEEPEAIICINYVTEEDAVKIIESGREEIKSHADGFLQNVPVGN